MKKSQIFLGASAFLLAISGALATKASLKNIKHIAGFTSGGVCVRLGNLPYTTIQHNNASVARTASATKTLYTVTGVQGTSTVCGKVLYTNPQN